MASAADDGDAIVCEKFLRLRPMIRWDDVTVFR